MSSKFDQCMAFTKQKLLQKQKAKMIFILETYFHQALRVYCKHNKAPYRRDNCKRFLLTVTKLNFGL
jgi:hypothetical protein